jgi:hypothetical protein
MVHLSVSTHPDLIDHRFLKIGKDGTGNVLASLSLREEGVERIIPTTESGISGHLTIGLDTVLKAEKFPALVTDLATSLSEMDGNDFTKSHF